MHLFTFHLNSKLVDWFKFLFLYFFICLVTIVCTNNLKLLAMIVVVCVRDTHNDREWSDNVMLLAMLVWERQQMQDGMQRPFFNNYPDLAQGIKTILAMTHLFCCILRKHNQSHCATGRISSWITLKFWDESPEPVWVIIYILYMRLKEAGVLASLDL